MSVSFFSSVKWLLLLILDIILTAVFAGLTWACWGLYQQEKISDQYQKEGQPVTVTDYAINPSLFIFAGIVWLLFLLAVSNRVTRWPRKNAV